jgi:hypothetical protein
MKTISLDNGKPTLDGVLRAAEGEGVVYLFRDGRANFALIPLDGSDAEVLALRGNQQFMGYLSECEERARTQPRTSLKEIRAEL